MTHYYQIHGNCYIFELTSADGVAGACSLGALGTTTGGATAAGDALGLTTSTATCLCGDPWLALIWFGRLFSFCTKSVAIGTRPLALVLLEAVRPSMDAVWESWAS
jgi:hypothetical protein